MSFRYQKSISAQSCLGVGCGEESGEEGKDGIKSIGKGAV